MIFYLSPDTTTPSGGIRVIYRHVDILNDLGIPAMVLHETPDFRCEWFPNTTPIGHRYGTQFSPRDLVVIPEVYGPDAATIAPGTPKVVFNQSGHLTFHDYPLDGAPRPLVYHDPELFAALVISENVESYLHYAFPDLPLLRTTWSLDPELFSLAEEKRNQIAFMPRRNPEDARQVFNLLRLRGVLGGFDVVPIEDCSEIEVASILGESSHFFSFGTAEGLPLPPAEAMARGCVVVGYDGFGGREYFRPEFCHTVPACDVLEFARIAEGVLRSHVEDPAESSRRGRLASEWIHDRYSPERERENLRRAFETIAELMG